MKSKRVPYNISMTQGQGSTRQFGSRNEIRLVFIEMLGKASIQVQRNGKDISFEEACSDFELDEKITQEIIDKSMELNSLYRRLRK